MRSETPASAKAPILSRGRKLGTVGFQVRLVVRYQTGLDLDTNADACSRLHIGLSEGALPPSV